LIRPYRRGISPRVCKIYPGCRILGAQTVIGPGCVIGREAPATVLNCQLAAKVDLAGGYVEESVFLSKTSVGSGAHIRPGCLLEEEAGVAHSVGLKQTVLLPCVTAGSLINFCDALMAGGEAARSTVKSALRSSILILRRMATRRQPR